jgi:hypothetical protein
MGWVYQQTQAAFAYLMAGNMPLQNCVNHQTVQRVINDSKPDQALNMLAEFNSIPGLVGPDGKNFSRPRKTAAYGMVRPRIVEFDEEVA